MWTDLLIRKAKVAAPTKKKRSYTLRNIYWDEVENTKVDMVQKRYIDWKNKSSSLSLGDIGVTGRGHSGKGKKTLLEHVEFHVQREVQREGQPARRGVEFTIRTLDALIIDETSFIDKNDIESIEDFIGDIREMGEGGSDTNPSNILFTQHVSLGKKGGKWIREGEEKIYGHYRTKKYIDGREKVDEKKESLSAVPNAWWSTDKDNAQPPFWQAIFATSSLGGAGTEITHGLLGILEDYIKSLTEGKIPIPIIKDKGRMKEKISSLNRLGQLKSELGKLLKDSSIYRGRTGKVKYDGPNGIRTKLNDKVFKVQGAKRFLKSLGEIEGVPEGDLPWWIDKSQHFMIDFTKATIDNMINEWFREQMNFKAPTGYNIGLGTDTRRVLQRYSWYDKYKESEGIKKSWNDWLWSI
jgi:hypothetical protein